MDINAAIIVFAALSQETRLRAFRLLVQAGHEGLAAGALSDALGTPHNTLSFHLSHLLNASIVSSRKSGRSVIYSANFGLVHDLIGFLVEDCCRAEFAKIRDGEPGGWSVIELAQCCSPVANATQNER